MTTALDEPTAAESADNPTGHFPLWVPRGPGAARMVAYVIAGGQANPHSHLVIDGETECASGHCCRPDDSPTGALR